MLLLALAALSGCHSPHYLEDVRTPALVWTQGWGLCSKIVVVDGGGTVWVNQGCEDGRPDLAELRTINAQELAGLWSLFAALPAGASATLDMCGGTLLHQFARWDAGGVRSGLATCGGSFRYDDVEGLPEGFRPLAGALRDFE